VLDVHCTDVYGCYFSFYNAHCDVMCSGDDSATAAGVNDIWQHAGLAERYAAPGSAARTLVAVGDQKMLVPKKAPTMPKPVWHPPWKLFRVCFLNMFTISTFCLLMSFFI